MPDETTHGGPSAPDFLSDETFANPYPLAARLRQTEPVHWSPQFHAWVVSRFADVAAMLHDPRFAADRLPPLDRLPDLGYESLRPLFSTIRRMFLFHDPPAHARLRRVANRSFTRPQVERWRVETQTLVDELLDRVAADGRMDALADLSHPLPLAVISRVVGFPADALPRLKVWSDSIAAFFGHFLHTRRQLTAVQQDILEFSDYLRALIAERRQGGPRPDLLSSFVHDSAEALSDDEIVANAILIVGAGHVTTTDLIGNGTLALLRHPDQARRVSQSEAGSGFIETAIEELLRYDSPVQMSARVVKEAVEIGGQPIRAGQWTILWLGAANRDPARFAEPDRLDLDRADNRHVAFGSGAHFCLGAPLARLQAQVAIGTLFRRFPGIRLASESLTWEHNPTLRGLTSLPVLL